MKLLRTYRTVFRKDIVSFPRNAVPLIERNWSFIIAMLWVLDYVNPMTKQWYGECTYYNYKGGYN